jgi:hypothetical protein
MVEPFSDQDAPPADFVVDAGYCFGQRKFVGHQHRAHSADQFQQHVFRNKSERAVAVEGRQPSQAQRAMRGALAASPNWGLGFRSAALYCVTVEEILEDNDRTLSSLVVRFTLPEHVKNAETASSSSSSLTPPTPASSLTPPTPAP